MLDRLRPARRTVLAAAAAVAVVSAAVYVIIENDGEPDELVVEATTSTTLRRPRPSTTSTTPTTATTLPPTPTAPPVTDPVTTPPSPPAPTEPPPPPGPPPLGTLALRLETVAQLDRPLAMAARPGTGELWIAEKGGRIVALRGGGAVTVGDLTGQVSGGGEQGLLGLAFTPAGDRIVLSYTDTRGDSRLDVATIGPDGIADVAGRTNVFFEDQPFANHNGGHIVLGPDGFFYLGLGDGGSGGDPNGNAQNLGTRLGKLLRIDPNTFAVEIVALGLRNPWRFSFDRATADVWVADVGQGKWEEVNALPFGALRGANFGWDRMEGTHPFDGGPAPGDVLPIHEYDHGQGCSVTGGFVYRGAAIAGLDGAYLYGDFCEGVVRALRPDGAGGLAEEVSLGLSVPQLASFGEDAAGELYTLSLGGRVSRIVAG